ncbi:MAG TPA: HU family DNA-binding protein [Thermoanaerobaculia bacterium]
MAERARRKTFRLSRTSWATSGAQNRIAVNTPAAARVLMTDQTPWGTRSCPRQSSMRTQAPLPGAGGPGSGVKSEETGSEVALPQGYNARSFRRGSMIKADIVDLVVDLAKVPRAKAATAVETVIESMRSALGAGDRIELRGFGVFQVKRRKRGIGRNPKTGIEVTIPPGNTIRFKPGKDLRDLP